MSDLQVKVDRAEETHRVYVADTQQWKNRVERVMRIANTKGGGKKGV